MLLRNFTPNHLCVIKTPQHVGQPNNDVTVFYYSGNLFSDSCRNIMCVKSEMTIVALCYVIKATRVIAAIQSFNLIFVATMFRSLLLIYCTLTTIVTLCYKLSRYLRNFFVDFCRVTLALQTPRYTLQKSLFLHYVIYERPLQMSVN